MKRNIKYVIQLLVFFTPAILKKLIWRSIGFRIGSHVKIGMFSLIMVDSMTLADGVCIDPFTMVVFLEEFTLGERCRLAYFSKIYGKGIFHAESRCLVSVQCLIECSEHYSVIMKDYSCFGPRNTIYTHGDFLPKLQGYPSKRGNIVIGAYSWTGMSTVIMPGTVIGENSIITPGAVLRGIVPDHKFIQSSAYKYDCRPIEEKIVKRSNEEINQYIRNVVNLVLHESDPVFLSIQGQISQNPDLLFSDLSLPPLGMYEGRKFVIAGDFSKSEISANDIVLGYKLPGKIKNIKTISWMEFENYRAWPKSDKILSQLISRLYHKFDIRFLLVKD